MANFTVGLLVSVFLSLACAAVLVGLIRARRHGIALAVAAAVLWGALLASLALEYLPALVVH